MRTNFFSYATDKERLEKSEAMQKYSVDLSFGFERVYNREHQFKDVVEGSVPEGCYTLVISGLEDLGSGLSEIRDSLKFIDNMGYKLEVLFIQYNLTSQQKSGIIVRIINITYRRRK